MTGNGDFGDGFLLLYPHYKAGIPWNTPCMAGGQTIWTTFSSKWKPNVRLLETIPRPRKSGVHKVGSNHLTQQGIRLPVDGWNTYTIPLWTAQGGSLLGKQCAKKIIS